MIFSITDDRWRDQDVDRFAGVLELCPEPRVLFLHNNHLGSKGEGRLPGVLSQSPGLSCLFLVGNRRWRRRDSCHWEVMAQCQVMSYLESIRLELKEWWPDCFISTFYFVQVRMVGIQLSTNSHSYLVLSWIPIWNNLKEVSLIMIIKVRS